MNTEKYKLLTFSYIEKMKAIIITVLVSPASIVSAMFFLIKESQDQVK